MFFVAVYVIIILRIQEYCREKQILRYTNITGIITVPPERTPGPKGISRKEIIDGGTLALNATAPPVISTSAAKDKEGTSWSKAIKRRQAYTNAAVLTVAEIFFATDDDQVHSDDILAMNDLISSIKTLLKNGFELTLLCIGQADYRASFQYNKDLGKRRARSVKDLIDISISHKNLTVEFDSIGESKALQAKHGRLPSLTEIMNDRKVVVTIDTEEFIPPVTISVMGNWIHNLTIESTEINNGGRVVAAPSSPSSMDAKHAREHQGLEHDPILPLVVIKTNYYIKKINNKDEACVECKAVHQLTNKVLFEAFAQTDSSKIIKEQVHYNPNNPTVKRKVTPGVPVPQGHVTEERTVTGVNMRGLLLSDPIYVQLKGSYKNITERIKAILAMEEKNK